VSLFSTQPNPNGFQFDDVTEQAAKAEEKLSIDEDYNGPATIFAYTVAYNKGNISHAIAYCDTPEGKRTVLRCNDLPTAEQMTKDEFIGQRVHANRDGSFNLMTENFF
jgi:hypothetical protein